LGKKTETRPCIFTSKQGLAFPTAFGANRIAIDCNMQGRYAHKPVTP
jgi:hypothetical protein